MNNPYEAPRTINSSRSSGQNNSGQNDDSPLPPGVAGWSWGAFLLNWIWAIGNSVWIGLLAFIPYIGFVVAIYLGIKGREMAWRKKRWESVEHFNEVQKSWSKWALIIVGGIFVLSILAAIILPAYQGYASRT